MPPALDQDAASWRRLSGGIQKSRSHLALFEAVDRSGHRCRQTEHHNAFGYLESYPVFSSSVSSSCHQLVRSSPESLFCRLPAESRPLCNSRAGRNESSAIFAVLGLEKASGDSLHSQTERRQHMSPMSPMPFSSPSPVEKVFQSYRGPDLSSSPLSCFSRLNRSPLDAHPFPKTSSPLGYLPISANPFLFSVPSAMSEDENVSTAVQCHALPFCRRRHGDPCTLKRSPSAVSRSASSVALLRFLDQITIMLYGTLRANSTWLVVECSLPPANPRIRHR